MIYQGKGVTGVKETVMEERKIMERKGGGGVFEGVSVEGSPVEVADIFQLHLLYPLVHDCSLCSSETLRQTL